MNIILDRVSGSISEDDDFIVSPFIGEVTDPAIKITLQWDCFLNNIPCTFPYDESSQIFIVSQKYVKLHLFNKIIFTVTSTTIIKRRLQSLEINDTAVTEIELFITPGYVPSVNIFESQSMEKPNLVSGQNILIFKGIFKDFNYNDYRYTWKIDKDDKDVFVSPTDQVKVGIDIKKLSLGDSYKLSFEVTNSKNNFLFFYDFTINTPPKLGICKVSPETGVELETSFIISCTDWEDAEENYPILYSFGYYDEENSNYLLIDSKTPYFSTVFPYKGKEIWIFKRVIDSLGDFTEVSNLVKIKISANFDPDIYFQKVSESLEGILTKFLPNTLTNLASAILNRDLYIYGDFQNVTNSTLETMNYCYNLIINKLDSLISISLPSTGQNDQLIGIMNELTRNSFLITDENFYSISNTTFTLLNNSKEIGLSASQAQGILSSISSSIKIDPSTLYNKPNKLKSLENVFNEISSGTIKNSVPNTMTKLSSGDLSLNFMSLDKSNIVKDIKIESAGFNTTLPSSLFSSFSDLSDISIFGGHMDTKTESNVSVPTMTYISIHSTLASEIIPVQLETNEIIITIPVSNTILIKEPACFYLNSSNQWDKTGCIVLDVTDEYIICGCSHLSLFSSGEGVEGGGFAPSSNIDQTVNIDGLSNINAKSAIGFYFVGVILTLYFFFGIIAWKKDSIDIKACIDQIDEICAKQIIENQFICVDSEESHNSLVNNAQIAGDTNRTPRLARYIKEKTEDIKRQTKTGLALIIQEHRLLNILYIRDPRTFRSTRCSLLFLIFIGKMYFIGLFYESETKSSEINSVQDALFQYELRDFLIMVYSTGIVILIDLLLYFISRTNAIEFTMPREVVMRYIKVNKKKRVASLVLSLLLMVFYCWSIAMFALNLEYTVSLRWVINTAFGILSDLIVSPIFKLAFKAFILSKLILYYKLRGINRTVVPQQDKIND